MSKIVLKSFNIIFMSLALALSMAVSAGAMDNAGVNDIVILKNGDKVTGTVLNDTFTVSTPYSVVTLKKDKISQIGIHSGNQNDDVIELIAGGSVEGTIDAPAISLKLDSGKNISIEKEQCSRIILKTKTE